MERDGAEVTNIKKNSGAFLAFGPSSDAKSELNRLGYLILILRVKNQTAHLLSQPE
jgi:hypothetical protein